MPELAEVETVKRYLEKHILDQEITEFKNHCPSMRYPLADNLASMSVGARIENIRRRGKYLLLDLSNKNTMILHLGMSGRFFIQPASYKRQKHDHITINLSDDKIIIFNDARRFGMCFCLPTKDVPHQSYMLNLGVEPLEEEFNFDYMKKQLQGRNQSIKSCLMNNGVVVGVGNIYAAESLFVAKIHPRRPSFSMSDKEIARLVDAIKDVLLRAIDAGGTTLKDFVGGNNEPGYFKQELNVYDRENMPCVICKDKIITIKQSGRTSFFCPTCQL